MKIERIGLLLLGWSWLCHAADSSLVKSVYVNGAELYVVTSAGGMPRQITHDGLRKSLPVWSPEGGRIAFVQGNEGQALADLVVISSAGDQLQRTPFRPKEANTIGMRFVEQLQWISKLRVAVCGSINPSTVEYAIVEVGSGKEVDWYSTDGFSLAPSPDGTHVAYEGYVPHFVQEVDRRPRLCVDHECDGNAGWPGYPDAGRHIEFVTSPAWSPSGSTIAAVTQDYATKKLSLVVRPLTGRPLEHPLPAASLTATHLSWKGDTVFAETDRGVWKIEPNDPAPKQVDRSELPGGMSSALQLRKSEKEQLAARGATEVDLWCISCPLELLPRRQGPLEAR